MPLYLLAMLCFYYIQNDLYILNSCFFVCLFVCFSPPCCALSLVQLCFQDFIPIVTSDIIFSLCLPSGPLMPLRVCITPSSIMLLGVFATSESFWLYPKRLKKSRLGKLLSSPVGSGQSPIIAI